MLLHERPNPNEDDRGREPGSFLTNFMSGTSSGHLPPKSPGKTQATNEEILQNMQSRYDMRLSKTEKTLQKLAQIRKEKRDEEMVECTFKPMLAADIA